MSARWTITNSIGTEKTLADWGISGATLNLVSLSSDTLELVFKGMAFDAEIPFPFDSTVTLKYYNASNTHKIWFIGRVMSVPRAGEGDSESIRLTIHGLWEELEQTAFQQSWKTNGGDSSASLSRIIMGQSVGGAAASIADGVAEVIAYAATVPENTPIQLGTNVKAQYIPFSEVREQTCASMLRLYLAWQPSRVSYFDYGTTPPTLHFIDRPDAPAISLPVTTPTIAFQIVPRPDLQVPVVAIKYLLSAQIEGNSVLSEVVDRYPVAISEVARRAVVATFDLDGGSVSTSVQKQKITTRVLPLGNWTDVNWWKTKVAWMRDSRVSDIVIEEPAGDGFVYTWGSEATTFFYPREIVSGSFQDWMSKLTSPAIHCVTGKVVTLCTFKFTDPDGAEQIRRCQLVGEVVSTNASSTTYKKETTTVSPGQTPPTGVAQTYYESLAPLQYDGSITMKEAEVGSQDIRPGFVVNLTGSRAEWASMRAQIQSVSFDINAGETTVTIGPAKHLGLADLMRLMQPARIQQAPKNDEARASGKSKKDQNEIDGASAVPNDSGSIGGGINKKQQWSNKDDTSARATIDMSSTPYLEVKQGESMSMKSVRIDLADIGSVGAGSIIKLRQLAICEDGVKKNIILLASESF